MKLKYLKCRWQARSNKGPVLIWKFMNMQVCLND